MSNNSDNRAITSFSKRIHSKGQVTVPSDPVRKPAAGTKFTFTVDNVSLNGWIYDAAANGDFNGDGTSGDTSNSITVR